MLLWAEVAQVEEQLEGLLVAFPLDVSEVLLLGC